MAYLRMNGKWYIENDKRMLFTDESSPHIMHLSFPDLHYKQKHNITEIEDMPDHRMLQIEVCFN